MKALRTFYNSQRAFRIRKFLQLVLFVIMPMVATYYSDDIVTWMEHFTNGKAIVWDVWQSAVLTGSMSLGAILISSGWWRSRVAWRFHREDITFLNVLGSRLDRIFTAVLSVLYRTATILLPALGLMAFINHISPYRAAWLREHNTIAIPTAVIIAIYTLTPFWLGILFSDRLHKRWFGKAVLLLDEFVFEPLGKIVKYGSLIIAAAAILMFLVLYAVSPYLMTKTMNQAWRDAFPKPVLIQAAPVNLPEEPVNEPTTIVTEEPAPVLDVVPDECFARPNGTFSVIRPESVIAQTVFVNGAETLCPFADEANPNLPETIWFEPADETAVLADLSRLCTDNPWLKRFALSRSFGAHCDWINNLDQLDGDPVPDTFVSGCTYVFHTDPVASTNFLGYHEGEVRYTTFHYSGAILDYVGENIVVNNGNTELVRAKPGSLAACDLELDKKSSIEDACAFTSGYEMTALDFLLPNVVTSKTTGIDYECHRTHPVHRDVDSLLEPQALREIDAVCGYDNPDFKIKSVRQSGDLTVDCATFMASTLSMQPLADQVYSGCTYEWSSPERHGFFLYVQVNPNERTAFWFPNGTRAVYNGGKLGNLQFKLGELIGSVYNAKLYGSPTDCTVP